jgi:KDO2-lipid IV(A) lauroyltransferase
MKSFKNTIIYFLARLMMGLARLLPFGTSRRLGRFLGRRAFAWASGERKKTLEHLRIAFPEMDDSGRSTLAAEVFEHFGMAALECVNVHKLRDLHGYMRLEPPSRKVLEDLLARGRGLIFVTAHCGNWELMARALGLLGFPVNTIGKKSYDPRFTRMMERFREEGGVHTIWRGDPDVTKKMVAVLKRGQILGLLIDQDTKVPGVFVPFFGRKAFTPSAAAFLARRTGAAVVTGFNHRDANGGYRTVVEAYEPCGLEDEQEGILEDTRRLTARIEAHVRGHPAEWVWMHRRWKTQSGQATG